MSSLKPMHWVGIALGGGLILYLLYTHLQYFGDLSLLGGILLLEVLIICLWKYDQRFFVLLMITFLWAGMPIPLQGSWTAGRWVVLSAGAFFGYIVWIKAPRRPFGLLHLVAFSCVFTAFVSATVSQFVQMASLKAVSLLFLFLYCSAGARAAVIGREDRFFHGLVLGSEIAVYATAICYLGLGKGVLGNPNSLGAVMGIGVFPVLLWAWITSSGPVTRARRLVSLLLCTYLVAFSMARAAMVAVVLVTFVLCFCLRQYRLLLKTVAILLLMTAVTGMFDPRALNSKLGDLTDAVLYKGHKEEGVLGSRKTPWDKTIASIKEHPFFGTGYGTSPSGEDPGLSFGTIASSMETEREHGSSYMTIAEWVGLVGVMPFVVILAVTVSNLWRVCAWMRRTSDPRHCAIPLAMVVFAGLVHAAFEDWLFAVGYYLCVYFWFFSFLLADLVPENVAVPLPGSVSRSPRPSPASFGSAVPNPVAPQR
jgi:O-antigen ligase